MSIGIDQRAAGIARVDRRIGLDEIFEGIDAEMIAAQRRHDAHRDGLSDAERIADREHDIAHLRTVELRQRDRWQVLQVDLHDGEIGLGIGADQFASTLAPVGKRDFDFVGRLNHVIVGQDITIGADDHAGAKAELPFVRRAVIAKEAAEEGIVIERARRLLCGLGREDVHDGRHGALRCDAVGILRDRGRAFGLAHRHRCRLHLCPARRASEPLRLQGRYNEPQGKRDRDGLREQ